MVEDALSILGIRARTFDGLYDLVKHGEGVLSREDNKLKTLLVVLIELLLKLSQHIDHVAAVGDVELELGVLTLDGLHVGRSIIAAKHVVLLIGRGYQGAVQLEHYGFFKGE